MLISLAFIAIIAILTIVTVKCVQDMPVVSILLGTLDVIMIFLLLSIISRAFGTGKVKSQGVNAKKCKKFYFDVL